ncbi:unnamed protein product, partial [Polarella glacialis]
RYLAAASGISASGSLRWGRSSCSFGEPSGRPGGRRVSWLHLRQREPALRSSANHAGDAPPRLFAPARGGPGGGAPGSSSDAAPQGVRFDALGARGERLHYGFIFPGAS